MVDVVPAVAVLDTRY